MTACPLASSSETKSCQFSPVQLRRSVVYALLQLLSRWICCCYVDRTLRWAAVCDECSATQC